MLRLSFIKYSAILLCFSFFATTAIHAQSYDDYYADDYYSDEYENYSSNDSSVDSDQGLSDEEFCAQECEKAHPGRGLRATIARAACRAECLDILEEDFEIVNIPSIPGPLF